MSAEVPPEAAHSATELSPEILFQRLLANGAGMYPSMPLQDILGIILELVSKRGDTASTSGASIRLGCISGVRSKRDADFATLVFIPEGHYLLTYCLRHVSATEKGVCTAASEDSAVTGAVEAANTCLRELNALIGI